jgi:hypothetical protein
MTTRVWVDIRCDAVRMVQYSDTPNGRAVELQGDRPPLLLPRHQPIPDEAFTILREPQELLDELLKAGYRPSDNKWTGGHVKALEKHIEFAERVATILLERKK